MELHRSPFLVSSWVLCQSCQHGRDSMLKSTAQLQLTNAFCLFVFILKKKKKFSGTQYCATATADGEPKKIL